jgi:1-acyl-sn-glycerol-3-phosphate acyltransferase
MKRELLKIPLFGWALSRTGGIALDRSKGSQAMKRMRAGSGKLTLGWCVLVYVEGTRSRDGSLQPLKRGAFVMAVNAGVPILPVTVNGSFKVLPRNSLTFRPGHITVTISDPIMTLGMTEDDVPGLMEKTRNAILNNLDVDYDPFIGRVS